MLLFNPEHDLVLANGDRHFVPPESSLKFGADCAAVMSILYPDACEDGVYVWGWDINVRQKALRCGAHADVLPSLEYIESVRNFSNRKYSVLAYKYILERIEREFLPCIVTELPALLYSQNQIQDYCSAYEHCVLKAPWSGSGKGLRWISNSHFSQSDIGWCRNTLGRQGCVVGQKREKVVQDFAMLFSMKGGKTKFEGYSLFDCSNGVYKSNLLASNDFIENNICLYIPRSLIESLRGHLICFFDETFGSNYEGTLGVDMLVALSENGAKGGWRLMPCVEINVRNTMGLVARRYFDSHEGAINDGELRLEMIYSRDNAGLREKIKGAQTLLTPLNDETLYAICCNY